MKRSLKLGILSLVLVFAGGSVALLKTSNNRPIETQAKIDYVANDGTNNLTKDEFITQLKESTSTKTYEIKSNITLTEAVNININKTTTIDLKGYSITGNVSSSLFNLSNATHLIINSSSETGAINNAGEEIFDLTGATLELSDVNLALSQTTSNYYPISASSGTNIIRTTNVQITKGYTGIRLIGTSSLYSSGSLTFTNQNASGYSISCGPNSSVYLSGALFANSIFANNTIYFYNGNTNDPEFLAALPRNVTIVVGSSLRTVGAFVLRGAEHQTLLDKVIVSELVGYGFDHSIVDCSLFASGNAKDIQVVFYSCTPTFEGSKYSVYSPNPITSISYNSNSTQYYEFDLLADYGYYFAPTNSGVISVTVGGETVDWTYGKHTGYNNSASQFTHATVRINKNLIKQQVVITANPIESLYLTTAKNFIAENLHMDDYDPGLTGVGSGLCKSYYNTAKTEFEKLGNYYRNAFMLSTDEDVVNGRNRFIAWAASVNDEIVLVDGNYNIVHHANEMNAIKDNNTSSIIVLASVISFASITAIVLYIKKRKETTK